MLEPQEAKEIDVQLSEYQVLRSEINLYSRRIDTTIGFYITVVFTIIGYFLRPESGLDIAIYLEQIRTNATLTALLLVVPILNSIILIRLTVFLLAILAMAKYLMCVVSTRLSILLKSPVLGWDKSSSVDTKKPWLALRFIAQALFAVLSEGISVLILVYSSYALTTNRLLALLYIGSCFSVILSILGVVSLLYAGSNFQKGSPSYFRDPFIFRLVTAIAKGFRSLVREIRRVRSKTALTIQEAKLELSHFTIVMAMSSLATGFLYIGIFAPLAWVSAINVGLNPIDVLLLQSSPPELNDSFFSQLFPRWSVPEAQLFVYSFGAMYGVVGLVSSVILLAGNLPRLVVTSNGLLYGFLLTRYLTVDVFRILELDAFSGRMFFIKLAYIFLAYYLSEGMVILFGGSGYSREKYEFLFDGMYGLASGWILARGFGAGSTVFIGALFLSCTFIAMAIVERFMAWIFKFIRAIAGKEFWKAMERERSLCLHELFTVIQRKDKVLVAEVLIVFLGFTIFPVVAAGIYHFALEGRF